MTVVLATRNVGKIAELQRILGPTVELVGLDPGFEPGPETGATFEENALAKAAEACLETGLVCVADDSGLAVDALNGMPGVLSARWAGTHGDDAANNALLLGQLEDVPDARRGARFVCAAALVRPDGSSEVVRGEMTGHLLRAGRGGAGFGYDPLFVPDALTSDGADWRYGRTSAELTPAEKDAISHRGSAFRALAALLR